MASAGALAVHTLSLGVGRHLDDVETCETRLHALSPSRSYRLQRLSISFGAWAIGGHMGRGERHRFARRAASRGREWRELLRHRGRVRRWPEREAPRQAEERDARDNLHRHQGRSQARAADERGLQPCEPHVVVERSLRNLGVDALDLLQLHCPPPDVYYMPEVFGMLDDLVRAGKFVSTASAWSESKRR